MKLGILALQGDYEAHARALAALHVEYSYITYPEQLNSIQGLIIPGGESTVLLNLLEQNNFFEELSRFTANRRIIFGTCAGTILLARKVTNPSQFSLNFIDINIERNAYGRQLSSHIGQGQYLLGNEEESKIDMFFIRAPKITQIGPNVEVFATYQGEPVGVSNDCCMVTTFHPELSKSLLIHQLFILKANSPNC